MTMKHVIHGLMAATQSKNHNRLAAMLDLPAGAICRLSQGKTKSLGMGNLSHVQEVTGVPFETLFAWYRLPTHAQLDEALGQVA